MNTTAKLPTKMHTIISKVISGYPA
jgi:hypothetical protein